MGRDVQGQLFQLFTVAMLLLTASAHAQTGSKSLQDQLASSQEAYRSGDYAESLRIGELALARMIVELGSEHEQVGIQAWGLGLTAERTGRLDAAEQFYARSVAVREKVYGPDSPGTAQALESLGHVLLKRGRADHGEELFRRVLKVRQEAVGANHAFTASSHANLASVALARGDAGTALLGFREAVRLLVGQDISSTVVKSLVEDDVRRNRDTFTGLARAAWMQQTAQGMRPEDLREEAFKAAQYAWQTSAASAVAKMTARLGAGDTELGRRVRRVQDLTSRVLALQAADSQGLADWSGVQRSNPEFSRLLEEFRAASIAKARDGAPVMKRQKELADALQAELARCPPGQKRADCASSETVRTAITKELQTLSQSTASEAAPVMAIHQRMQAAERALPGYATFTARRATLRNEIDGAEREIREARSQISRSFPQYVALAEPQPLSIVDVQSMLQPDEALVAYHVGTPHSFVWAISQTKADWALIDASAERLAATIASLRLGLDPLAEADVSGAISVPRAFDFAQSHSLYQLIVEPVASIIAGKKHVLFVPSGPLTRLPFQVLVTAPPTLSGGPGQVNRDSPWLIKSTALSVLPSVPALYALRRLAGINTGSKPFFGVGDPVLQGPGDLGGQGRSRRKISTVPAQFYRNGLADVRAVRELAPLPDTADEINTIARLLGAPIDALLLGQAASEARVKSANLGDYRVVHFATHGLVAGELSGVAEPALVLTPPDLPTASDDGLLTASEIAMLRLNADWVVLSACNTAAGTGDSDGQGADALSGLARAFFYAGARALMVSHWAVYSEAATSLTTRTFRALSKTPSLSRAEAFRQAMLSLIAENRPPAYWAPFVIVGEGGPTMR